MDKDNISNNVCLVKAAMGKHGICAKSTTGRFIFLRRSTLLFVAKKAELCYPFYIAFTGICGKRLKNKKRGRNNEILRDMEDQDSSDL